MQQNLQTQFKKNRKQNKTFKKQTIQINTQIIYKSAKRSENTAKVIQQIILQQYKKAGTQKHEIIKTMQNIFTQIIHKSTTQSINII